MSNKQITDYVFNSAAFLADPDSILDSIRKDGPIVWCPSMNRWLVLSKSAALTILKSRSFAVYDMFPMISDLERKSGQDLGQLCRVLNWIPFLHEGDRHKKLRLLFSKILSAKKAEYIKYFEIRSKILLDEMCKNHGGDFVEEYCNLVHAETMCKLMGFSNEDAKFITDYSDSQGLVDFSASLSDMVNANERMRILLKRLENLVDSVHNSEFTNLVAEYLGACGFNTDLDSITECIAALILLGRDALSGTFTIGLSNMMDDNQKRLNSEHFLEMLKTPDELIRLSSAIQMLLRVAIESAEIEGQKISKGDSVILFLPAANLDPESYECPHQPGQSNQNHVAFGNSRHLCTGMPITRAAVRIALRHLAECGEIVELPSPKIDASIIIRKFKSYPIKILS
jgi:cytochrome P450